MRRLIFAFIVAVIVAAFSACTVTPEIMMNTERKILGDAVKNVELQLNGEKSEVLEAAKKVLNDPLATSDEISRAISSLLMFQPTQTEKTVVFVDPAFEKHIRTILGKTYSDTITVSEAAAITELDLSYDSSRPGFADKIIYTDDLKWFPALKILDLSSNAIRDLKGIGELVELEQLDLSGNFEEILSINNKFIDFSVLGKLKNLRKLDISSNGISDISSLSALTSVTDLYLSDNNISSLAPIASLNSLTSIYLDDSTVKDISPLFNISTLEVLSMCRCNVDNNCGIEYMKQIKELYLAGSTGFYLVDISPLSSLETLDISNVGISKVNFASDLDNLRNVNISGNKITDISVLLTLPALEKLDASSNSVKSVTIGTSVLKHLDLSSNRIEKISFTAPNNTMTDLDVSYNRISTLNISNLLQLKTLDASVNFIEKVTELSSETLEELYLYDNIVFYYTCNMPSLRVLSLEFNPTRSISGIETSPYLYSLNINDTRIYDLSQLSAYTNLRDLTIDVQYATDMSDVSDFTFLESLTLCAFYGNYWDVLDPLRDTLVNLEFMDSDQILQPQISGFSKLETLTFKDCTTMTDVSLISDLPALKKLSIDNSALSSPYITGFRNLTELSIVNCGLKDISFIFGLPSLTRLELMNNSVSTYAFANFPSIKYLGLSNNGIKSLNGFSLLIDDGYVDLSHNEIKDLSPLKNVSDIAVLDVSYNNLTSLSSLEGITVSSIIYDGNKID